MDLLMRRKGDRGLAPCMGCRGGARGAMGVTDEAPGRQAGSNPWMLVDRGWCMCRGPNVWIPAIESSRVDHNRILSLSKRETALDRRLIPNIIIEVQTENKARDRVNDFSRGSVKPEMLATSTLELANLS
jgi:hypothetical protein